MTTDVQYNFDELCLQDLLIEQVSKTPDAIAVVDGKVEVTYRELDDITSKLAIQLIEEYNVGPDSVVGILLPRSIQYVISYVAILKAGGAYMPLELVYPKQLLERAVLETHSKVVLTNHMYADRVKELPHLALEDARPFVTYETSLSYPPPSYVHPKADHLAFCVMSSGTTGTPKGICQTHRAAVHSYLDRFTRFPYHEDGDRVGAGVFFVWELYRPLCRGVTCVVIPDHVLFDPHAVTKFVQDHQITRWLVTPSLMQLIHDTVPAESLKERLPHLRYIWFCGEVVSTDLAKQTTSVLPHIELMNLYSISECHDVSIGDLKRELDFDRKYATCGKAIPGVHFYVVDLENEDTDRMTLVEEGQTGEVYVGGPVVGRGYLNMPEKTAERFVPNPFDDTCPRLYKTGDLGRIQTGDGQLEILGRCDFMVKIRGYSVVLGAIETALAKHPKLSSSVVLAVGSEGSRDKKLVAYVVPTEWKDPPSASSVRSFLKDHVPTYAIPSTFCVINALPVAATAAGKLDRKKLPDHKSATRLRAFSDDFGVDGSDENNGAAANNNSKARFASTEEEKIILEIWSDLLGVAKEELSCEESFFEVGGHSLLATQLVGRVNEKFQKTTENGLTIMNVVESATIRDMAKRMMKDAVIEEKAKIDLEQEAQTLDPSIYPFPTRKGNTMARFRMDDLLLRPRVVFLTGGTGYLGAHILAELLQAGVTVIALARAKTDDAARERLMSTLQKYNLSDDAKHLPQNEEKKQVDEDGPINMEQRLVPVAGDLSQPLLGIDTMQFKMMALEIDAIIHCGAQVNLIKPYSALKESNVLGTQEILRLATTNGFVRTKVKPVYYISTNGIFPVTETAYPKKEEGRIVVPEDVHLPELAPHLDEGYAQTKWVAEEMCNIAESRGLPVCVLRPGNMAGSTVTGVQNQDDLNFLLLEGMIESGCAPVVGTNYALDLTPVDFAARAVVHLTVDAPQKALGQRMHLQSPQEPVALSQVVDWLKENNHNVEGVTRELFMERIASNPKLVKLSSGWLSFEKYFEASTWLQYGSDHLQQALPESVSCHQLDKSLLAKWFPN